MDRNIDAGGDGSSRGRAEETAALLGELIEALTALGNYLETARQVSTVQSDPAQETLAAALERSAEQFERSVGAARRLQNLVRRESKGDP
jgi:hypothetical protein